MLLAHGPWWPMFKGHLGPKFWRRVTQEWRNALPAAGRIEVGSSDHAAQSASAWPIVDQWGWLRTAQPMNFREMSILKKKKMVWKSHTQLENHRLWPQWINCLLILRNPLDNHTERWYHYRTPRLMANSSDMTDKICNPSQNANRRAFAGWLDQGSPPFWDMPLNCEMLPKWHVDYRWL